MTEQEETLIIGALELSHVDECISLWESEGMAHEIDFRKRLIRAIMHNSNLTCSALADGRVVGCALALYTEFSVYVHRLVVHQDYRRRGIGRRIMAHLEQNGRQLGADKIILNAEGRSASWYERLGYEKTEASFFFKPIGLM